MRTSLDFRPLVIVGAAALIVGCSQPANDEQQAPEPATEQTTPAEQPGTEATEAAPGATTGAAAGDLEDLLEAAPMCEPAVADAWASAPGGNPLSDDDFERADDDDDLPIPADAGIVCSISFEVRDTDDDDIDLIVIDRAGYADEVAALAAERGLTELPNDAPGAVWTGTDDDDDSDDDRITVYGSDHAAVQATGATGDLWLVEARD